MTDQAVGGIEGFGGYIGDGGSVLIGDGGGGCMETWGGTREGNRD